MRVCIMAAAIASVLAAASQLLAGNGWVIKAPTCQEAIPACGCDAGDPPPCDPCRGYGRGGCGNGGCGECGCGLFGRKCRSGMDGLDRFANCACNGSYNYPVPPLYTYHWPGMYKQVRMTDYHSPWRFPPLKRYEDEPLPPIEVPVPRSASGPRLLKPVSLDELPAPSSSPKASYFTEIEPLSSRLSR